MERNSFGDLRGLSFSSNWLSVSGDTLGVSSDLLSVIKENACGGVVTLRGRVLVCVF